MQLGMLQPGDTTGGCSNMWLHSPTSPSKQVSSWTAWLSSLLLLLPLWSQRDGDREQSMVGFWRIFRSSLQMHTK